MENYENVLEDDINIKRLASFINIKVSKYTDLYQYWMKLRKETYSDRYIKYQISDVYMYSLFEYYQSVNYGSVYLDKDIDTDGDGVCDLPEMDKLEYYNRDKAFVEFQKEYNFQSTFEYWQYIT